MDCSSKRVGASPSADIAGERRLGRNVKFAKLKILKKLRKKIGSLIDE
jgi:hypothetical protein